MPRAFRIPFSIVTLVPGAHEGNLFRLINTSVTRTLLGLLDYWLLHTFRILPHSKITFNISILCTFRILFLLDYYVCILRIFKILFHWIIMFLSCVFIRFSLIGLIRLLFGALYIIFLIFFFRGHGNEFCNLVTLSWVAEYIPTFAAIFHRCISFFRLGGIFKQRRRLLTQADK